MVHVGMQETHYRQREDRFCRPPACRSLRLLPDGNFWAAAVAGLGPRWRPVADPGCGHEWCHWGRQEAALRAMVSALSEHFDKTLRFVSPPPATGPPRRTRTGLRTRTAQSANHHFIAAIDPRNNAIRTSDYLQHLPIQKQHTYCSDCTRRARPLSA